MADNEVVQETAAAEVEQTEDAATEEMQAEGMEEGAGGDMDPTEEEVEEAMEAEGGDDDEEEEDEEAKPDTTAEDEALNEYKPFYKQRTYAKYASKAMARAGERKIVYVGPLRWSDLKHETIVEAVEKAEQAQIRRLDALKGEKFSILDLVMPSSADAKKLAEDLNMKELGEGWKVQASVQLDAVKRGCRKPLMLYFIDYKEYEHEDQEYLAELNFHYSYDRLHRLWVYIENIPEDCTDEELTEAIPDCLQAIAIKDEEGKPEGYGYGRFMTGKERIVTFNRVRSDNGIELKGQTLKIYPVNSDYDRLAEGETPTVQVLSARLHKLQQSLKFQQMRNRRNAVQNPGPYGPPPPRFRGGGRGGRGGYRGGGGGGGGGPPQGQWNEMNPQETAANLLYGLERLLGNRGGRGGRGGPGMQNRMPHRGRGGPSNYRGGRGRGGYY